MKVEVRLFAGLNKYVEGTKTGEPFRYEMKEGATASKLIMELGIPEDKAFVVLINGESLPHDTNLKEGDRVGIFPPVGGG